MKQLDVRFQRTPTDSVKAGTLAEADGKVFFEYDAEFLATGLNLSPIRLPFEAGLQEHRDREFGPIWGLFDDSLPDGWGLLLMDRHFRNIGQRLAEIGPLDRLAWLGSRTMGALTYDPPVDRPTSNESPFDLHELASESRQILTGQTTEVLPQLLQAGGSPGGARPKVLVGWNPETDEMIAGQDDLPEGFEHWIVKFAAKEDDPDSGATEYEYSQMAREAGITMPPTRLFETSQGERFFGCKRFDRGPGNRRFHVHTFGNLIHSNFRIPSADYLDLLRATRMLTQNHQDVLAAYRLAAFNVLTHNRDDHVKNFSYRLNDETGLWELAPAYDLTRSEGPGGEHSMTILGEGRNPTADHLLALAEKADIPHHQATEIIQQVQAAVQNGQPRT
jgi:serine/threonine-protein kinase HipA